jgi:hypothetical protein
MGIIMMITYAAIFTIIVLRRYQRQKTVEGLSMASQPFLIEKVVSFPSVVSAGLTRLQEPHTSISSILTSITRPQTIQL